MDKLSASKSKYVKYSALSLFVAITIPIKLLILVIFSCKNLFYTNIILFIIFSYNNMKNYLGHAVLFHNFVDL